MTTNKLNVYLVSVNDQILITFQRRRSKSQKLVSESKKYLDEVCKQHKLKPQIKLILSDLMDKVSSEQLDEQVFQGNDRFDEENGPCEAFKRVF